MILEGGPMIIEAKEMRVHTQVQQGASPQIGGIAAVRRIKVELNAQVSHQHLHLADRSLVQQRPHSCP